MAIAQPRRDLEAQDLAIHQSSPCDAIVLTCGKLKRLHPEDGKAWFARSASVTYAASKVAALVVGGASGLSGMLAGAGWAAVAVGALQGLMIGLLVAVGGLTVGVALALCRRFYCRLQTRLDGAGEVALLHHLHAHLAASPNKGEAEFRAVRVASRELWRLSPGNWLLQGALGSLAPLPAAFLFVDPAPLLERLPGWRNAPEAQPAMA